MPASGAVDGGLCAVGAGGEVERGVGRFSSAIYGKEEDMRPKRYPYSGKKKGPIAVTIDPKGFAYLMKNDEILSEKLHYGFPAKKCD